MKKVLIITYYWPPSGGAGVQRWLKFVKYFRQFGWEPIIYTPENPEAPAVDLSLEKDIPDGIAVLKTPVWEPYTAYKRWVGKKKDEKIMTGFLREKSHVSLTEKIAIWIRGNIFIPDARKYWIRPSVKFLMNYLKNDPVDVIVSTGPPHSMHLIAAGVHKQLKIPWVADFRDPWTNIDFYNKLMLSGYADRKHKRLEKKVLENANKIVVVNWNMAGELKDLGAKNVEVITNGYDPDDYSDYGKVPMDKFEIIHIGSMNADRNPGVFWEALGEKVSQDQQLSEKLQITFVGQTDISVFKDIEEHSLKKYIKNHQYISHKELHKFTSGASVLLLPLNDTPNVKGISPGKLYEYLAMEKPIFCIGPEDGDSARIINECRAGVVVGFRDKERMKTEIGRLFENCLTGHSSVSINSNEREKYSRVNLTLKMTEILEKVTKKSNA